MQMRGTNAGGGRLQHLREKPTVGGTSVGEPDGMDSQTPSAAKAAASGIDWTLVESGTL